MLLQERADSYVTIEKGRKLRIVMNIMKLAEAVQENLARQIFRFRDVSGKA